MRIKNRWSRRQQDRAVNAMAVQGWELTQRSPRGGLLGGGADTATFRRPVTAGSTSQTSAWDRLAAWWDSQTATARKVWTVSGVALLAVLILTEVFSG